MSGVFQNAQAKITLFAKGWWISNNPAKFDPIIMVLSLFD